MSFRSLVLAALIAANAAAAPITGVVRNRLGRPIEGAMVAVVNLRGTVTGPDGAFSIEVPNGTYRVIFSHPGYGTETRTLQAGDFITINLLTAHSETIVVSGIRAEETTPVTKTDVPRQAIEKRYHQQDVPLLLSREVPSINAWSESGVGHAGYSYITLRGVSPTRINFTLDGVPLADSEDFGTYFADFPDLARSLQSIQVQRGVGTSTVGSPSFGGSVNMESIDLSRTEQTDARVAGGSFGTRFATAGYQSGALPGGFLLYARASYNETDGFRDSSGMRQRNLFVSAAKQMTSAQLRFTGFSAHEWQNLSFFAADKSTLEQNLRANPLVPEEKDSFGYDLGHLQYLRSLSNGGSLTASAYYQRGYGWYRLYDYYSGPAPLLKEYGLDGLLFGGLVTYSERVGDFTTNYGVHVNRFEREHTRDAVDGPRDYFNYGVKGEANAFAKINWDAGAWHLYGDAQVRYTSFDYHGDVEIAPIDWTFFNPKIGARYRFSSRTSIYTSAGVSTREPTRNDMFLGEDNPTVAHDLGAVRPERLYDYEAGLDYRDRQWAVAANLYAMEFRNEIAATGELSDIGLMLRRNVDRSYRRGIELDAAWQARPSLRLRTIANASRNRIARWLDLRDVQPLLTPNLIVNQSVDFTPSSFFGASLLGRYVSRSFLDNTNDDALTTPSFFVLDGNISVGLPANLRLSLQVNNLLDNDEVFPTGYVFDRVPYLFPQSTRNFVVMLDYGR
jgi:iron complex outermembrane receptor protein